MPEHQDETIMSIKNDFALLRVFLPPADGHHNQRYNTGNQPRKYKQTKRVSNKRFEHQSWQSVFSQSPLLQR
jgi:hypothetical protein